MLSLEKATELNAQMVEEASLLLHEKNGFMKNGRICRQYIRQ